MTDSYTFKKFSKTEFLEEIPDNATLLIEDGGDIKRVPASQVGGTDVQADLTQNDSTAPDYVKGRTHWSELEYGKLLEIEGMETNNMGYTGYYQSNELYPLQLSEGLEYEVIINGVSFTTTCFLTILYDSEVPCLGNPYILNYYGGNDYEDNGLPFAIYLAEFNTVQICINDWNPAHIVVNGNVETVHPISKKYLPNIVVDDLPGAIPKVTWYSSDKPEYGLVYVNKAYYDEDGDVSGCYCSVMDVTDICGDRIDIAKFKFTDSNFNGGTCTRTYSDVNYYSQFYSMIGVFNSGDSYAGENIYSYKVSRKGGTSPVSFYFIYKSGNTLKHLIITLDRNESVTTVVEDVYPKAAPVADAAGETPTATEFNALLASLRAAGLLNTAE